VKVGDTVEEYDDICEVSTDKLVAKIPSSAAGVITAVNFGDDEVCAVGHALVTIEEADGSETTVEVPVEDVPVVQAHVEKAVTDKVATAPPGN